MDASRLDVLDEAAQRRFWAKVAVNVEDPSQCWPWLGARSANGYGAFAGRRGGSNFAHRWSYQLNVGPIPEGLEIDHLCNVRHCVNPDHLEPVTSQENLRRAAARRTHCRRGHPWIPENTYWVSSGEVVRRKCKACVRANHKATAVRKPRKTHCKHGHLYDEANTYWAQRPNGRRSRMCRTCMLAQQRARTLAKRLGGTG